MKSILIIDDIKEYLDSISRILSRDYEVISAMNLTEAKDIMSADVDLALVDRCLSESDISNKDGILFLEWLSKNYPDVPAIMMSAYEDSACEQEAASLGYPDFIKKPIDLRKLRQLITSAIAGQG